MGFFVAARSTVVSCRPLTSEGNRGQIRGHAANLKGSCPQCPLLTPLSATQNQARSHFDGRGLYLEISPTGGKWWRLKYRFDGKEKRLSLGVYPDVSLKDARERRDDARKLLANEIDPSENRKAAKAAKVERAANSFEVVAREWYAKHSPSWSPNHGDRIIRRLERDIFPWIGGKPIAGVSAPQ